MANSIVKCYNIYKSLRSITNKIYSDSFINNFAMYQIQTKCVKNDGAPFSPFDSIYYQKYNVKPITCGTPTVNRVGWGRRGGVGVSGPL